MHYLQAVVAVDRKNFVVIFFNSTIIARAAATNGHLPILRIPSLLLQGLRAATKYV